MSWQLSDITNLAQSGKIRGYTTTSKNVESAEVKPVSLKRVGLQQVAISHITEILAKRGIGYDLEYKFLKNRKFRFDVAVTAYRIGIEYEGMVGKGQVGGHQTKAGYAANCTKYNLAAIDGWVMLRYTARTYKNFENDIINLLMNKK